MKNKQTVQFGFKLVTDIDFGILTKEYAKGELKIDRSLWEEYIEARNNFEILHDDLVRRIRNKPKVRKWLQESICQYCFKRGHDWWQCTKELLDKL